MNSELLDLSKAYLMGWRTIRDIDEWLAGIDWENPDLDPESLELAGRLELLATEVLEGLRPENDFWQEASKIIERQGDTLYSIEFMKGDIADSSNNSTIELILPVAGV